MTKQEIISANKEFLFPAVFHFYKEPLVIVRAKDQYVWDADGNQYLDFLGGIVTVSVGHCNEQVNAKVHQQLDTLQHVSTLFANEPQAALAKKIASRASSRSRSRAWGASSLRRKSISRLWRRSSATTAASGSAMRCRPAGVAPAASGSALSNGA